MAADTGILEAMDNAGISHGDPLVSMGHAVLPVPQTAPIPDLMKASDCICYVTKSPNTVANEVICQSVCQRVGSPQVVDIELLLKGSGTFTWDDTNSGFSVDGGTNYYALEPDTTDPRNDTGVLVVDQEYQYTMVLDMTDHIDDFLEQEQVDYLVSFSVS
jgi:hypothetical protein